MAPVPPLIAHPSQPDELTVAPVTAECGYLNDIPVCILPVVIVTTGKSVGLFHALSLSLVFSQGEPLAPYLVA